MRLLPRPSQECVWFPRGGGKGTFLFCLRGQTRLYESAKPTVVTGSSLGQATGVTETLTALSGERKLRAARLSSPGVRSPSLYIVHFFCPTSLKRDTTVVLGQSIPTMYNSPGSCVDMQASSGAL